MSELNKLKELANSIHDWPKPDLWTAENVSSILNFALSQINQLESAQQHIAELEDQKSQWAAWAKEGCAIADELQAEIARRDAAAGEPVACLYASGDVLTRSECNDDRTFAICCKVETPLFTVQPSALPWKVESCSNCGSKNHSWDTTVIKNTRVQDGLLKLNETSGLFYLGCDECSETLLRVSADEVAKYMNNAKAKGFTEAGD